MGRFIRMLTVAAVLGFLVTVAASANAQGVPSSYNPPLGGSADAPKTVTHGQVLTYAFTLTDMDTFSIPFGGTYQMADNQCAMAVVSITSIQAGMPVLRGFNSSTGTYTWDTTGYAVQTPGIYYDRYRLYNNRSVLDVLKDPTDVTIIQTVIVN